MPIPTRRRRIMGGVGGITYLLRALFTAADQGYSNGQVLDTVVEGVQDGQLTVVEVDGTLAIVSNKCAFTAQSTPAWGDLGFYSQAITKVLGKTWLHEHTHTTQDNQVWGFYDAPGMGGSSLYLWQTSLSAFRTSPTAIGLVEFLNNDSTQATDLALVLGGYDSNGVPWRSGETAADYLYGAAFFVKRVVDSAWSLIWRTAQNNASPLYVTANLRSGVGTLDNFRVPTATLEAVLQPTCLSTFTAANGTSLDAITPEVGGTWTEHSGDFEIQSNKAQDTESSRATVDSGIADVIVDVTVNISNTAANYDGAGLTLRYADADNRWVCWSDADNNTFDLIEVTGGVSTVRATASPTVNFSTDYDIRAVCEGTTIDGFFDGGNKITYGSASAGQTNTKHGLLTVSIGGGHTLDNFACYARQSAVYDSTLDSV